jgi:membrane protein DedA with SNARE-associated domain
VSPDAILELVPLYGAAAIFLVTALSCFGVPIPGSLALLAGGAFVASGDMDVVPVVLAGYAGATLGDQAGYWLGARGGAAVLARARRRPAGRAVYARARRFALHWGWTGVFLTRWLVSALGPAVNLASGTLGMAWPRFSSASLAGEAIWVGGYVALGAAFSGSFAALATLLGDVGWTLAGGLVTAALGARLLAALRAARRRRAP